MSSGMSDPYEGTVFGAMLRSAGEDDLSDLEASQCVGLGHDNTLSENDPTEDTQSPNCIYFIPQLGYSASNDNANSITNHKHVILERMTSLFLKKSQEVVTARYSIVYCHCASAFFSQAKILRHLYSVIPYCYRKNLSRLYVLHPTTGLKLFFRVSKWFFEEKAMEKICFFDNLFQFQRVVSPVSLRLPLSFVQWEDGALSSPPAAPLSLIELYQEELQSPPFISECVQFLQAFALQREGVFRVPGDQTVLDLCTRRFRGNADKVWILRSDERLHSLSAVNRKKLETLFSDTSESSDASNAPNGETNGLTAEMERDARAVVVVDDVDEVAQLLKAYMREMQEPVISGDIYSILEHRMRDFHSQLQADEVDASEMQSALGGLVEEFLEKSLHPAHWKTLQLILKLLADVAALSQVNKMTPDNISTVFAPTLMNIDMSSPQAAVESLANCQKIVRILLLRKMEKSVADRIDKIAFSRYC